MCEIYVDDYCELWRETRVGKARKEHRCDSCRGPILPGESYVRHFSVFEGYATGGKVCDFCHAVRDEFLRQHGAVYAPKETLEMLEECVEYDDGTVMAAVWHLLLSELRSRRPEVK